MHAVTPPPRDPVTEPGPWNAVAAGYDEVFFSRLTDLTDAAIELLRPESGDRVLDVATGPGTVAVRLAPRVGHVMAIDFAEGMIELLRGHAMRSRLPNLEARVMDGEDLAFEDSSFDAAISMFGVFLFDDRKRGLSEMLRVVVPGGRVLFSSWAEPSKNSMLGVGLEALRAALPDLPRQAGPTPTQDPARCAEELEAVGFEQVSTQLFERKLSYTSVSEYWSLFERGAAPLAVLKNRLGAQAYAEAAVRAQTALSATYGNGPLELTCSAILTYGERPLSAA